MELSFLFISNNSKISEDKKCIIYNLAYPEKIDISEKNINKNLQPNAITFAELSYIDPNTYEPQYSTPKILLGNLPF